MSADALVRNRRDCVSDQISIFSAISMVSSASIPRYRTVLSISLREYVAPAEERETVPAAAMAF